MRRGGGLLQNLTAKGREGLIKEQGLIERWGGGGGLNRAFTVFLIRTKFAFMQSFVSLHFFVFHI